MITPPYLKKGDTVGIVATARKIQPVEIETAVNIIKSWGLNVVFGPNLFKEDNQYAGTDAERAADMQWAMDDETINAVIFARGGYGTVRIIDKLDFTKFCKRPKWIVGYSDITVAHSHINRHCGVETIHGSMLSGFPADCMPDNSCRSLHDLLLGLPLSYDVAAGLNKHLQRTGEVRGELVGGNLSLLYALLGSASDIDPAGKILFIEDLDEYLYHIDRMMMNLKRNGKLQNLKALIVGGMSEMRDNPIPFGKSAEEIIADAVKEYNYPVVYNFPAGHIKDNRALVLGRNVRLSVDRDLCKITF